MYLLFMISCWFVGRNPKHSVYVEKGRWLRFPSVNMLISILRPIQVKMSWTYGQDTFFLNVCLSNSAMRL